jgi:hypothetical protein
MEIRMFQNTSFEVRSLILTDLQLYHGTGFHVVKIVDFSK